MMKWLTSAVRGAPGSHFVENPLDYQAVDTTPILLTTLNATYSHASLGLRYLLANLEELAPQTRLVEFTLGDNPRDIAAQILARKPELVAFGVYVWNVRQTEEVVSVLKRLRPELFVVLGGPEVSHETQSQRISNLADVTIQGEGEIAFRALCRDFFSGKRPSTPWVTGSLPNLETLCLPYSLYSEEDIRHRVIYVEASRGCPFRCEFCLSSLDEKVRSFPVEKFLSEIDRLIQRGARQFKFVDRTFNVSLTLSQRILSFFLERVSLGLFLHFEMIPDRLPAPLRDLLRQFPQGSLQLEIGIQTWDESVARRISRFQNYARTEDNLRFLREQTQAHLHADLIVGLPGETEESFACGFNRLASLNPHEIQVGLLKRLKGTPITRHDDPWQMVYQEDPPFTVLSTRTMPFETIQFLSRFAAFWNKYANSGNFKRTMALFRRLAEESQTGLYEEFARFTRYLNARHARPYAIALLSLVESAWHYLVEERGVEAERAREVLRADYCEEVRRDVPVFLRFNEERARPMAGTKANVRATTRQERHALGSA